MIGIIAATLIGQQFAPLDNMNVNQVSKYEVVATAKYDTKLDVTGIANAETIVQVGKHTYTNEYSKNRLNIQLKKGQKAHVYVLATHSDYYYYINEHHVVAQKITDKEI